jgi:hypothetical protein
MVTYEEGRIRGRLLLRTQIRVGEFWKSKFSLHLRVKVSYDQNVCLGAVFRVLWHVWRPGQLPVGSLDRRISRCCGDPHSGAQKTHGWDKTWQRLQIWHFYGFRRAFYYCKRPCATYVRKKMWWLLHLAEMWPYCHCEHPQTSFPISYRHDVVGSLPR